MYLPSPDIIRSGSLSVFRARPDVAAGTENCSQLPLPGEKHRGNRAGLEGMVVSACWRSSFLGRDIIMS